MKFPCRGAYSVYGLAVSWVKYNRRACRWVVAVVVAVVRNIYKAPNEE